MYQFKAPKRDFHKNKKRIVAFALGGLGAALLFFAQAKLSAQAPEPFLKTDTYRQLGKALEEPLYVDELEGLPEKLAADYGTKICSGEELDFLCQWYDLDSVGSTIFVWSEEPGRYSETQLKQLGELQGEIILQSETGTVPDELLGYLTGIEALEFDLTDVIAGNDGILQEAALPDNIKEVRLSGYTPGKYDNLFTCMKGTQVEMLSVEDEPGSSFVLDRIAGMPRLTSLELWWGVFRAESPEKLDKLPLQSLKGGIDGNTDLSFLQAMPALTETELVVTGAADVTPLLSREGLSMRLRFCQEMTEYEEADYPGSSYVVCPGFDQALGWKDYEGREDVFLAIYQKAEAPDNGVSIECFTLRSRNTDEEGVSSLRHVSTVLRVAGEGEEQMIWPDRKEDISENEQGSFRRDLLILQDINIDGYTDISLDMGSYGSEYIHKLSVWLWDAEKGMFIEN